MAKTSKNPASSLLAWYDRHKRDLPWRVHAGRAETPYHTWISEIMLQQTGVITVIPYYQRFITAWPTVNALAAAHEDEVLSAWAGLGYYSRARNLLKCARMVSEKHDGIFPSDLDALRELPGIGDYTANAIRAIAFDMPANVVDGNVERVIARMFYFKKPLNVPKNKKELKDLAATFAPKKRPGDYAQAIMDLGATICTPRAPRCPECPWKTSCAAFKKGNPETLPTTVKKKLVPHLYADVFVIADEKKHLYLRQRPSKGLLGGLWEFPSTEWQPTAPIRKKSDATPVVRHVFSHFRLDLCVHTKKPARMALTDGKWFKADSLPAMPTLMAKVLKAAEQHLEETLAAR